MARLANDCSYGVIALNFARAVANEDVDAAFRMLSSRVREVMSKDDLIDAYQEMISCGDGPADTVEVMIVDDDMPSFIKGDLAWVYVSILGPSFSEAVVVIVMREGEGTALRIDSWGRF